MSANDGTASGPHEVGDALVAAFGFEPTSTLASASDLLLDEDLADELDWSDGDAESDPATNLDDAPNGLQERDPDADGTESDPASIDLIPTAEDRKSMTPPKGKGKGPQSFKKPSSDGSGKKSKTTAASKSRSAKGARPAVNGDHEADAGELVDADSSGVKPVALDDDSSLAVNGNRNGASNDTLDPLAEETGPHPVTRAVEATVETVPAMPTNDQARDPIVKKKRAVTDKPVSDTTSTAAVDTGTAAPTTNETTLDNGGTDAPTISADASAAPMESSGVFDVSPAAEEVTAAAAAVAVAESAPVAEIAPAATPPPPPGVGDPVAQPTVQPGGLFAGRQASGTMGGNVAVARAGELAARMPQLFENGLLKRSRRVQARKVRRVVRHIDPWSVLTFSVLFHLCVFAALLLSSVLVWNAAAAAGTIEKVESFIRDLGDYTTYEIKGDVVFRAAMVIAGILTLASSVLMVLLTVIFNLISDLVGGIRLTVVEEETVRVRRRPKQ